MRYEVSYRLYEWTKTGMRYVRGDFQTLDTYMQAVHWLRGKGAKVTAIEVMRLRNALQGDEAMYHARGASARQYEHFMVKVYA